MEIPEVPVRPEGFICFFVCLFIEELNFQTLTPFFFYLCNFFKFLAERVLLRFEIFQKKQKMIVISLNIY